MPDVVIPEGNPEIPDPEPGSGGVMEIEDPYVFTLTDQELVDAYTLPDTGKTGELWIDKIATMEFEMRGGEPLVFLDQQMQFKMSKLGIALSLEGVSDENGVTMKWYPTQDEKATENGN